MNLIGGVTRLATEDPRSDEDLVEAANDGDESAFEVLYYRYRDWVFRLAYRFVGSHNDALDVLQETFAYLLKKFPHFRLTASMTTLLYPVVKHLSITIRRRESRYVSRDERLDAVRAPEATRSSRQDLAAVLRGLPGSQREVVLMRFVDGMSLKEIAGALRIPLGTVKSRLHNALRSLRNDPRTKEYFLE